ncbi:MAG: IS110 family transposase [Coprothermobacterota bacterium]|nr:IS110 family transposase [Coprothermobacterota bacterium]
MGPHIRVGLDVGSKSYQVGIAGPDGTILEEFTITHSQEGFQKFFSSIERHQKEVDLPVEVAMEGYNGCARPLDQLIKKKGYRLYNVNNLKLARFREIFPGPAKTDSLDVRKMLELFHLKDHLPLAQDVLQEVPEIPPANEKLKRLTRRRKELVEEKVKVANRMQADLNSVCPELLLITGSIDNLWFLNFLTSRDDLRKLARMHKESLTSIPAVGKKYAEIIEKWRRKAKFSPEAEYVSPMIISDAKRILELFKEITSLDKAIEELSLNSEIARRLDSIPGFGKVSSAELAGEIGTFDRFPSEASLALYLGMCPLDRQSGGSHGTKRPRQVNKRAKTAMMIAIVRHIGQVPESRLYYQKKRREGKKHNQAVRALGRHLVRVFWSMMKKGRDYKLREGICLT